jgi:hypothetical protein
VESPFATDAEFIFSESVQMNVRSALQYPISTLGEMVLIWSKSTNVPEIAGNFSMTLPHSPDTSSSVQVNSVPQNLNVIVSRLLSQKFPSARNFFDVTNAVTSVFS